MQTLITPSDKVLAEHEEAHHRQPWALVRELGYQAGFAHLRGVTLYNVVAGNNLPAGSTVTLKSLLKDGYRVEVVL